MKRANSEAPYIESEFLLLGLLREDKHVVTRWLGKGNWPEILRDDIGKRVYKGPRTFHISRLAAFR
jgi:hypothetical protein